MSNFKITVYPDDREFEVVVGGTRLQSMQYSNSGNAKRGARSAIKNLREGNVTNGSIYGPEVTAVTNSRGRVLAYRQYARPANASQTASKILSQTRRLPKSLDVTVER